MGGKGKERGGHEQPGETGKNGSPGGNSINFDTGGAPLGDGFVKVYRIA
jgi:hypothetical protein